MDRLCFEKQLSGLGFVEKPEMDRQKPFLLVNTPLLGRKNFRTEINTDYYGYKIVYYPKQFRHFVRTRYWHNADGDTASEAIEKFLKDLGL